VGRWLANPLLRTAATTFSRSEWYAHAGIQRITTEDTGNTQKSKTPLLPKVREKMGYPVSNLVGNYSLIFGLHSEHCA